MDPFLSLTSPQLNAITHSITGVQREYRHLSAGKVPCQYPFVWMHTFANELGRLTQGDRDIKSTNTIFVIPFHKVHI